VRAGATPLKPFLQKQFDKHTSRVEGSAIYMSIDPDGVPHALMKNLEHNHVMHERMVFLTVINRDIPHVPPADRLILNDLGNNCYQLRVQYGFKDEIDVPQALAQCARYGLVFPPGETSYFLSRATVVPTPGSTMALWREALFATMMHNVGSVAAFLKLPSIRVIELGARVEI